MKRKTLYCCELCDATFEKEIECKVHEAKHFKLDLEEYEVWEQLSRQAGEAGKRLAGSSNPVTRKMFDDCIQHLVDFEQAHNLTANGIGVGNRPLQFYF